MKVQEFIDDLGKKPPAPVYLFCPFKAPKAKVPSFEPLLAERAVQRAVETYVDPSLRDLCYSAYYADEADPAEIVSVAQTFPFLAERRVIVVQNATRYESESQCGPLLAYLAAPADTTLLLFVAPSMDRRSKFYKACEKSGAIVECAELEGHELALWIHEEARALGKSVDPNAVEEIMTRSGGRLSDVGNAIALVSGFVGEAEVIREEDVRAACSDVAEEEVWKLTDAIAASNTHEAIRVLRQMMDLGKSEFEILGLVLWLLKCAYAVAVGNRPEFRVSPYQARKVAPLAAKFGVEKLRDAFSLCMDTDVLFRSTGVDRSLVLELLVIKLSVPGTRRKAPART